MTTDDEEVGDLAGKRRNRTGDEQNNDQRILEADEELNQQRFFGTFAKQVGAEFGEPCFGLCTGQAGLHSRMIGRACRQWLKPP